MCVLFIIGSAGAHNREEQKLYAPEPFDGFDDAGQCPICSRYDDEIHNACSECGYNPYSEG